MPIKMMTAARSAGLYYKKRPVAKTDPKKKLKPGSGNSASSLVTNGSNGSGNSLTVPDLAAQRRRSGSVPVLKLNTLACLWNLRYEQVRAIRITWSRLCEPPRSNCKGIICLVERLWEKLDAKDSTVRTIFYNAAFVDSMHERCERRRSNCSIATLRDHTHFFVSLVSQVVMSLDIDPTRLLEHLDNLGKNHCHLKKYGFKSKHWEKIGEYFVDIVVIQDCVRSFPEATKAWTILMAAIIDRLRAAPRRGSLAVVSPSESQVKIQSSGLSASNTSIDYNGSRRGSSVSILSYNSSNGSQGSLPGLCPMRIPGHHSSALDLWSAATAAAVAAAQESDREDSSTSSSPPQRKETLTRSSIDVSSFMEMKNLAKALPEMCTSHPALA